MMSAPSLAAAVGPSAYWYLTRSTGAVALVLLTASVALGVADVRRIATERWPRFAIDALHRNVSLLAVAFLVVHIVTSVLDSFAPISLVAAVIPFTSAYRPFWLGLGAIAFDLVLAVVLTSVVRRRLGHQAWRATHWLAYASWPVAVLHTFGTGSDVKTAWLLLLTIACIAAVIGALLVRLLSGWPDNARVRGAALGGVGAFGLFLVLWLPGGPLGHEWARRAGTPSSLLHHSSGTASGARER